MSRDSSVTMLTVIKAAEPRNMSSFLGQEKIFVCSPQCKDRWWGLTGHPMYWVPGDIFLVKWPVSRANHPHPYRVEVKNARSYTSISIYQAYLHTDKFIFTFTNLHAVKNSAILIRIPAILAVENFKRKCTVLAWRCGQTDKPVPDVDRQASSRCGQTSQFQMWTDKPVLDVDRQASSRCGQTSQFQM